MKNKTGSMKARYVIMLAAMALLAGCAKEMNAPVAVEKGKTVLQVGLPSNYSLPEIDTKTFMGDKDAQNHRMVYWSNGDKISVNGVASQALAELPDSSASATFTFDQVLSKPYSIIYPASIVSGQWVELPNVQAYKAGGFADNMLPMCGYSESGTGITLYPMCAIVKITVVQAATDPDTDDIVAVRFRGRKSEKVSGLFSVSYDGHRLSAETGSGDELEVKVVKHQALSATDSAVYHIVVPARLYDNGFEVVVQDAAGHVMTKSKSSSAFLDPGHLYSMPKFEFVPTGTEIGVEISSAADLVQFATDFNNGVYAGRGDLVATLTQDITFDAESSAAFNATGGIGRKSGEFEATADNYFFGAFNGAGHTISGLTVNVPLFAYTNSDAVIENLNLDNTCVLTVTAPSVRNVYGALVGRNKGLVKNCNSAAKVDIYNISELATKSLHYGGLVGRNYGGSIEDCVVSGIVVCSENTVLTIDNADNSGNAVHLAGVSGSQGDGGSITRTDFTGEITISDGTTLGTLSATFSYDDNGTAKAGGQYFYVGGIAGYVESGSISHCNASAEGASKKIDVRGTLVPGIGGIAGWVKVADTEISDCNNYMSLSFTSAGARANTTPARVGGIAGRSAGTVSGSQNYGPITTLSNSTSIYLGGIVGDGVNVSNCINNSTGTITRTSQTSAAQSNRYIYIGGIMGANNAAGDVDHCTNKAVVLTKAPGTATGITVDVAGIVGWGQKQIDISNCENQAQITAQEATNTTVTSRVTVAGILAYGPIANTTVKNSVNSGYIYCQYNSSAKANGRCSYTGGIVGLMAAQSGANGNSDTRAVAGIAGLEISNCNNTGQVWSRNYNNTASSLVKSSFGGGVVGAVVGTAASKAIVLDCNSSTGKLTNYRGINGGIVGYAGNATVTNCHASQTLDANVSSEGTGGIAGWSVASSFASCSHEGSNGPTASESSTYLGGLVYSVDGTSSFTNCLLKGVTMCKSTNTAATAPGPLANKAASGATFTTCGVKGTIDGVAITLETPMITTDSGATVTGTYLID